MNGPSAHIGPMHTTHPEPTVETTGRPDLLELTAWHDANIKAHPTPRMAASRRTWWMTFTVNAVLILTVVVGTAMMLLNPEMSEGNFELLMGVLVTTVVITVAVFFTFEVVPSMLRQEAAPAWARALVQPGDDRLRAAHDRALAQAEAALNTTEVRATGYGFTVTDTGVEVLRPF